jgi:hypothetical protein
MMEKRKINVGVIEISNNNGRIYTAQTVGRLNFVDVVHRNLTREQLRLKKHLEKEGYVVSEGGDVHLQYDYVIPQTPKDNPITVKGNSRQEVIQGKHHSWPTAKKRKGFKS